MPSYAGRHFGGGGPLADVPLRRDLRSASTGVGSEFGLLALCMAAGLVGVYLESVSAVITIFVGGMVAWFGSQLPGYLRDTKARAVAEAKGRDAQVAAVATKAAADAAPPPAAQLSPDALLSLIKARRSIFPRDYTGGRVPQQQVEALLEAANWAPTHHLTEPWKFVVMVGDSKAKFEALTIECVSKYTVPADKAPAAAERMKMKAAKAWPLISHYIAICLRRVPSKTGRLNPEWEELASVSCAVQNMHLLASSMGLGAYWSSWQEAARDAPEMHEFLGLDTAAGDKCLGVFSLGLTERAGGYRGSRTPVADKVTWMD